MSWLLVWVHVSGSHIWVRVSGSCVWGMCLGHVGHVSGTRVWVMCLGHVGHVSGTHVWVMCLEHASGTCVWVHVSGSCVWVHMSGTCIWDMCQSRVLVHVSESCDCLGSYVWDTCLGHASGSCVWVVWDTCLEHSMLGPCISMTRPVGRHSCCSAQRPYFQAWVPWGILGMRMARWRPEALWSGKGLRVLDSRARGG